MNTLIFEVVVGLWLTERKKEKKTILKEKFGVELTLTFIYRIF